MQKQLTYNIQNIDITYKYNTEPKTTDKIQNCSIRSESQPLDCIEDVSCAVRCNVVVVTREGHAVALTE